MRNLRALFATTAFSSAFLIFLVQPLVGKHILPWYGGVPAVWMVCLCFYQLALFAGYGYAHWLASRVQPGRQLLIHALLFAGAVAALPVLPSASWAPESSEAPRLQILAMLAASVGLPFVMLAATGPLVQAWYARSFPARSPYVLYAVSNAGSLLALIAFPFAIEPKLPLSRLSQIWSWAFAACGLAALGCAWLAGRSAPAAMPVAREGVASSARDSASRASNERSCAMDRALWILLPACAVVLFMAVTNQLCLDVASFPFLWIAPLAIYLLTFIFAFATPRSYRRGPFAAAGALALLALVALWARSGESFRVMALMVPLPVLGALYLIVLFAQCMLVHGELYRLRPAPERLTAYYLCIAGGGSLGGIFVGIAAPRIFYEFHELPFGWAASWLLFAIACLRAPGSLLRGRGWRRACAASVACAVAALALVTLRSEQIDAREQVYRKRTFFNILRVLETRPANPRMHQMKLRNGTVSHGAQLMLPELKRTPITYFGAGTGIGLLMATRSDAPMRVGVIGLGVGSLAAYGRPGDHFRFYEIDPDVVQIARDSGYFSYLRDSRAEVEVVLGDARLSLAVELERGGPQRFDLLVVDAFTSDAIPVHLLTAEAFALYLQHLAPGGVLAVHASSVNFDLAPQIFRQAAERGLRAVAVSNGEDHRSLQFSANWVIIDPDGGTLSELSRLADRRRERLGLAPGALALAHPDPEAVARARLWTDDYSDLFSVLAPMTLGDLW